MKTRRRPGRLGRHDQFPVVGQFSAVGASFDWFTPVRLIADRFLADPLIVCWARDGERSLGGCG
jgi:hypothetical protein